VVKYIDNLKEYEIKLGKCYVNFTRSTKNANKTIEDVNKEYNEKEHKRLADLEHSENNKQLSLFD
jgi:hypothetical protein